MNELLNTTLLPVFSLISLIILIVLVIYLIMKSGRSGANSQNQQTLIELKAEKQALEAQLNSERERLQSTEAVLERERNKVLEAREQLERSEALLEVQGKQSEEKIQLLQQAQETLKLEFQNLANRIMEEKSQKFTQQNKDNLETLMNPLREQLSEFRKKVEDTYDKESKDRISLFEQILNLQKLNNQLSEDAHNLTQALKGSSKTQGNWGELVLERILEQSGLEKGREYETQSSFTQSDSESTQKRYQPDVLIHLPEGKTIILDSKVSLTAYEAFCSETEESRQKSKLKEHVSSVKKHVDDLSNKTYQNIDALKTLDFVVMFMPIEAAFLIAMQDDPGLYRYAMEKNIFIVSPSNLLVMLRTIHHTWRNEKQNQNAQAIAEGAGKLYDKFVGFVEDMDEIGKRIQQTQNAWDDGMKKLQSGSGNLVGRAEKLRKLGAKNNKQLPENLIENPDD